VWEWAFEASEGEVIELSVQRETGWFIRADDETLQDGDVLGSTCEDQDWKILETPSTLLLGI
jgi:hypothetical protein